MSGRVLDTVAFDESAWVRQNHPFDSLEEEAAFWSSEVVKVNHSRAEFFTNGPRTEGLGSADEVNFAIVQDLQGVVAVAIRVDLRTHDVAEVTGEHDFVLADRVKERRELSVRRDVWPDVERDDSLVDWNAPTQNLVLHVGEHRRGEGVEQEAAVIGGSRCVSKTLPDQVLLAKNLLDAVFVFLVEEVWPSLLNFGIFREDATEQVILWWVGPELANLAADDFRVTRGEERQNVLFADANAADFRWAEWLLQERLGSKSLTAKGFRNGVADDFTEGFEGWAFFVLDGCHDEFTFAIQAASVVIVDFANLAAGNSAVKGNSCVHQVTFADAVDFARVVRKAGLVRERQGARTGGVRHRAIADWVSSLGMDPDFLGLVGIRHISLLQSRDKNLAHLPTQLSVGLFTNNGL